MHCTSNRDNDSYNMLDNLISVIYSGLIKNSESNNDGIIKFGPKSELFSTYEHMNKYKISGIKLKHYHYIFMIDDRVKRGKDFTKDEKVGNYKSDFGIVLKIEQWDDTRLDNDEIRGDKIYLTWSSFRPFRFNYKGI